MSPRTTLIALALAILAPAAHAQSIDPAWTVTVTASLPAEVMPDQVASATLRVEVEGSGFACPEEQVLSVQLEATGGQPGVILELPRTLNLTVQQGEHVTAPWTGSADIPARLLVSRLAEQDQEVAWEVTARALASALACLPESQDAEGMAGAQTRVGVPPAPPKEVEHPSHEEHEGFDAYLKPGESFSFTFEHAGTYPYHDHLEPSRVGAVHVEEDGPAAASVTITASGYEPANVTVREGGTVHWSNSDATTRTVSLDELHGVEEFGDGHATTTRAMATRNTPPPRCRCTCLSQPWPQLPSSAALDALPERSYAGAQVAAGADSSAGPSAIPGRLGRRECRRPNRPRPGSSRCACRATSGTRGCGGKARPLAWGLGLVGSGRW